MKKRHLLIALTFCATAAGGAHAQEIEGEAALQGQPIMGQPIDESELEAMSGGESHVQVLTNQNLNAISSGNTIEAETIGSGGISFGQGALSGFTGVGNFVVNTGHNNTLQGSISVSVVTP